jgi:hypothetical protein
LQNLIFDITHIKQFKLVFLKKSHNALKKKLI